MRKFKIKIRDLVKDKYCIYLARNENKRKHLGEGGVTLMISI